MAKTSTPQTHVETPEETAAVAEAVEAAEAAATEATPAAEPEAPVAEAKAPKVSVAEPEAQTEAPAASAPAQPEEAATNFIKRINMWLDSTFPSSKNAVLGGVAGLIVALLFFVIGFWRTIFIVLLVLVGVALGQYADGDPKLVRAITKLIKKR